MTVKKKKSKKISKKLLHKYRLVILNEDTFEERLSFKLNRLNVFVLVTLSSILLVVFTILLIAFTSLREYIPGYSSTALKKKAIELNFKTDSLQKVITLNEQYYASIKKVLEGDVKTVVFNRDSIINAASIETADINLKPSPEDSLLRERVEKEDKYNLFENNKEGEGLVLFSPVSGTISQEYDAQIKHYAVDIVALKDTPVKAVAAGTVIFSEWTTETGYVIIMEHKNGILSVYKHNGSLNKNQGDFVRAGEVIASVGNTGELTTGPHLHFELWNNGNPVNPADYIDFN